MEQNLTLRPWSMDDVSSLTQYANNPNIAKNLTDQFPHPYHERHAVEFISRFANQKLPKVLAMDINGEAVGGIGLHPKEDVKRMNFELGYWLAEPFWGKGITTEAVKRMVDYGFRNWEITRIYATPFGPNIGSQKVLEKAGFVLEARLEKTFYKNGEFLDELIYAVRRENWETREND
ncbi:MAG: GNAT family protein [Bacteroidia bacterium]